MSFMRASSDGRHYANFHLPNAMTVNGEERVPGLSLFLTRRFPGVGQIFRYAVLPPGHRWSQERPADRIQELVTYFSPEPWSYSSVAFVFMVDIQSPMFSENLKCYQINPLR